MRINPKTDTYHFYTGRVVNIDNTKVQNLKLTLGHYESPDGRGTAIKQGEKTYKKEPAAHHEKLAPP